MPHPKDRKPRTRARILQAAATLFAAQGYAGTSIEAVMRAAGLTRGGFYAHFDSKAALYREALAGPAAAGSAAGDASVARPSASSVSTSSPASPPAGTAPRDGREALLAEVLDCARGGRAHPTLNPAAGEPGPWAFLATDATSRLPAVRQAYAHGFAQLAQRLQPASRGSGLAGAALLVGTLAVAMTLDDGPQRQLLLRACRAALQGLLDCPAAAALLDAPPAAPQPALAAAAEGAAGGSVLQPAPELLWAVDEAMADAARRWRQALH